jgi:hypothetical protein
MKYPDICEAKSKEEMQRMFEQHLKDCAAKFGGTPESHRKIQLSNVGYFTGYYDSQTAKNVYNWLRATHPVFGTAHAYGTQQPEDSFKTGFELGKSLREE